MSTALTPSSNLPPLRPMNLGDILDRAVSLYRQHFITMIGIVAVINIPLLLFQVIGIFISLPTSGVNFSTTIIVTNAISIITIGISTAAGLFGSGAIAVLVADAYIGQRVTVGGAYRRVLRHWRALLGAGVIVALVTVILFGMFLLPSLATGFTQASNPSNLFALGAFSILICCVGVPIVLPLFFLLITRWAFAAQAIVLEERSAWAGMRRSWSLVSGTFWRVLGYYFVLLMFVSVPLIVLVLLATFLAGTVAPAPLSIVLGRVATSLIGLLFAPVPPAVLTLLYYDLRIRKEGFDLEMTAQSSLPLLPEPLGSPL